MDDRFFDPVWCWIGRGQATPKRIREWRVALWIVSLAGIVVLASPAYAGSGAAEISEDCAVYTGCFSGDIAGYPVTIDGSAGGSYRLTSNLIVSDQNTDAIKLDRFAGTSLTIDLGGFLIARAGCENALFCPVLSGTGSGIEDSSSVNRGIAVRNGSIVGMGNSGVSLGVQAEVERVDVRFCGLDGIAVGAGSRVSNSVVFANGRDGIVAISGSLIRNNTARLNTGNGIVASGGSVISGNTAADNANGISGSTGSLVIGNTVRDNAGYGLTLSGANVGFIENVVRTGGGSTGTTLNGTDLGANACDGGGSCP